MAIVINGSGTVTGLAVGGLPDGTVDSGTLATNSVTNAKITDGSVDAAALAANSVDSAELIDGAVDRSHLATSIADSGNATAITISASENVRAGNSNSNPDKALLSTFQSTADSGTAIGSNLGMAIQHYGGANTFAQLGLGYTVNYPPAVVAFKVTSNTGNTRGDLILGTRSATSDSAPAENLRITSDGRGLSQFTAKAWVNFNGENTVAIRDSHNVSSITDVSVGKQKTNFANQMTNDKYVMAGSCNWRQTICGNDYDINYIETISGTFGGADAGADDTAFVHLVIFGD